MVSLSLFWNCAVGRTSVGARKAKGLILVEALRLCALCAEAFSTFGHLLGAQQSGRIRRPC